MKRFGFVHLILLLSLKVFVSPVFANESLDLITDLNHQCFDITRVMIPPCKEGLGLSLYFYKGSCTHASEIQMAYCATEELTNFKVYSGFTKVLKPAQVGSPAMIMTAVQILRDMHGVVNDCENAKIVTAVPKERWENYDPSEGERGIGEIPLTFVCND